MSRLQFLDEARRLEFRAVELCDRTVPSPSHAPEALQELAAKNLTTPSFAIRNDFTDPTRPLELEIDRARQGLQTASQLGAHIVRIWTGTASRTPTALTRVEAAFNDLVAYAHRLGLMLAVETHGGLSSDLDILPRLLGHVGAPGVGVCIDGGYLPGSLFAQAFETLADRIVHLHVKVHDSDGPGGPDATRHAPLLTFVRDTNYGGYLVIEYEGSGPRDLGVSWARDLVSTAWTAGSLH
ncbi:sugar phosphate isomerase/epimerase family protein [Streptomyces xanthochromogenes]|uniref:sugar phosphate isomerase/epimerase family protein n=1 Tax=Streptomyces xanthochromogenes TaxID=67384 RepID=UPI001671A6F2|nr:sugar phosphate isomerase/epimerase family protein [Streptomyces xanthochromogenes]